MTKNIEVDVNELERLAKFGGTDESIQPDSRGVIAVSIAASVKSCSATISSIAGVTSILSCNRTCGCR